MKALVTGIAGFAGSHMAEYMLGQNVEVHGTIRPGGAVDNIRHLGKSVHLHECELRDPEAVGGMLAAAKPDLLFHLAAQSFVPASWNSPVDTFMNNVASQLNLLEAVRRQKLACKIHIACSGEEYGRVEAGELPVREDTPLRPLSPYAVSKVTQDYLGYQYYQNYGLFIVRTRSFNHTGPRHGRNLVTSSFASQIADIEKGRQPPVIRVGNLLPKRDFTDVRDVVRAYGLALEKGSPGECYNVASGVSTSIGEVLGILLSFSSMKITVEQDASRLRPSDVEEMAGDSSRLRQATGWKPEIPLEVTLKDLLTYWRGQA